MLPIVLLTGLSGSGKSVALKQLEDLGYYCSDNLPVSLLNDFINYAREDQIDKVAVAIDVRSFGDFSNLPNMLTSIRAMGIPIQVIFLEASDQGLIRRYSESRRRHPLTSKLIRPDHNKPSLEECIAHERELLSALRNKEHVIDTTSLAPSQLREWIKDIVQVEGSEILLTFESFAYKKGVPSSADLVFDVRCLPNPYYDSELRALTGRDEPVAKWLSQQDDVNKYIDDVAEFIRKWLPLYGKDARSYLTVAIGCTGGQHRSVYVAERLATLFSKHLPLRVRHRAQAHLK